MYVYIYIYNYIYILEATPAHLPTAERLLAPSP